MFHPVILMMYITMFGVTCLFIGVDAFVDHAAGQCLVFQKPWQFASIGQEKTVKDFPTSGFTIEYWAQWYADFSVEKRGYSAFSISSPVNRDRDNVNVGFDDNTLSISGFGADTSGYFMPSAISAKSIFANKNPGAEVTRDHKWRHFSFAWDSSTGTIEYYVDDMSILNSTYFATKGIYKNVSFPAEVAFIVGQEQDSLYGGFSDAESFIGRIDELRIWSVYRDHNTVKNDRHTKLAPSTPDLWAYYSFDNWESGQQVVANEGSGGAAHDLYIGGLGTCDNDGSDSLNVAPIIGGSDAPINAMDGSVLLLSYNLDSSGTQQQFDFVLGGSTWPTQVLNGTVIFSRSVGSCNSDYYPNIEVRTSGNTFVSIDTVGIAVDLDSIDISLPILRLIYDAARNPPSTNFCDVIFHADGYKHDLRFFKNDPPTEGDLLMSLNEDYSNFKFGLLGDDVNGHLIPSVVITELPVKGVLSSLHDNFNLDSVISLVNTKIGINGPGLHYRPISDQFGDGFDSFKCKIIDEAGGESSEISVTFTVIPVNDLPVTGVNPFYLLFDGQDDTASFAFNTNSVIDEMSLSIWLQKPFGILQFGNTTKIHFLNDKLIISADTEIHFPISFNETWFNLVMTWSATHVMVYKDSILVGSSPRGVPAFPSGVAVFELGFEGRVDEIAVFDGGFDSLSLGTNINSSSTTQLIYGVTCNEGIGSSCACLGTGCTDMKLGGGPLSRIPEFLPVASAGEGFPFYNEASFPEEEPFLVQLPVTDVDTDIRMVANLILNLPNNCDLYQYDEESEDKIGALMSDPFYVWKSVQVPLEQWVSRVAVLEGLSTSENGDDSLKFSHQYGGEDNSYYSVLSLIGKPKKYDPLLPNVGYGDSIHAWSPASIGGKDFDDDGIRLCINNVQFQEYQNPFSWMCPNNEPLFIDVGFDEAVFIREVHIYENYYPGSIVGVEARIEDGTWLNLYSGEPDLSGYEGENYVDEVFQIFKPRLCNTLLKSDTVRIHIAHHIVPGWNEIDAIKLVGTRSLESGLLSDPKHRLWVFPRKNFFGNDSLTYIGTDCLHTEAALISPSEFLFDITPVNDPPELTDSVLERVNQREVNGQKRGQPVDFTVVGEDVDNDDLSFVFTSLPKNGQVKVQGKEIAAGERLQASRHEASSRASYLDVTYHPPSYQCKDTETFVLNVIDSSEKSSPKRDVLFQLSCGDEVDLSKGEISGIIVGVFVGLLGAILATVIYRRHAASKNIKRQCIFEASQMSAWSPPHLEFGIWDEAIDEEERSIECGTAIFQGRTIYLQPLSNGCVDKIGGSEMLSLLSIRHENLLGFVGAIAEPSFILLEYASKGTIYNAIVDGKLPDEMNLLLSLSHDAASGLEFLHNVNITHDTLCLHSLFFSGEFSCKISGFLFKEHLMFPPELDTILYLAPEVLACFMPSVEFVTMSSLNNEIANGPYDKKLANLYNYGLCAFSIVSLNAWPWGEEIHTNPNFVFQREALRIAIINNKEVPDTPNQASSWDKDSREMKVMDMIRCSLDRRPGYRPPCSEYVFLLESVLPDHSTILQNMQDVYLKKLESVVSERTKQLRDEKAETEGILTNIERLISSLLPEHIVDMLSSGLNSNVSESHVGVCVARIQIIGYRDIILNGDSAKTIAIMNDVFSKLDSLCIDAGVDHVRHSVGNYVICAGAFHECNNPVEKVITFAHTAMSSLEIVNPVTMKRITLGCGVSFGNVSSGVVGFNRMSFDLFGAPEEEAALLVSEAKANSILLSVAAAQGIVDKPNAGLVPCYLSSGAKVFCIPPLGEGHPIIFQRALSQFGSADSEISGARVANRNARDKMTKFNALLSLAGLNPQKGKNSPGETPNRRLSVMSRVSAASIAHVPVSRVSAASVARVSAASVARVSVLSARDDDVVVNVEEE